MTTSATLALMMLGALPETATAAPLRGHVTRTFGPDATGSWDANRCVHDPPAQLTRLRARGDILGFHLAGRYPEPSCGDCCPWGRPCPCRCRDHWQGVQRLPTADGRYFAVSSRHDDASRFAVVRIAATDGLGRIGPTRRGGGGPDWLRAPESADVVVHEEIVDAALVHAGGMQVLGRHLFVPIEEGTGPARVVAYDVGELADPLACAPGGGGCPRKLWDFAVAGDGAAAVAAAKLEDGRYALLVAHEDTETLSLYLSVPGRSLAHPHVFGIDGAPAATFAAASERSFRTYYQALSLLVGCEDGRVYLLGTRALRGGGRNVADLFAVGLGAGGRLELAHAATRELWCSARGSPAQCSFDAGAGAYVDPDGRLLLYATEHDADGPGGTVKMVELRPELHLDRPDTREREGCADLTGAFFELYDGRLEDAGDSGGGRPGSASGLFADARRPFVADLDAAYGIGDDVVAVRYCVPPGFELVVFSDAGFAASSRFLDVLAGDGVVRGKNFESNYGWSSACLRRVGDRDCVLDPRAGGREVLTAAPAPGAKVPH